MEPGKQPLAVTMPKRFTIIASILLGVIAAAQAYRAYYAIDITINGAHVPVALNWAAAGIAGIVAILAFREADS